ncbi:uncharacterized protein [Palaemon carinicauda]|uniref:uncharacterized protein n=1 Tax=Palaemon carinicauda TaxID=392227 RepID=UPI0035B5DA21
MYPTLPSFRPPSGMRCDSRLLSSFITGALTATTVTLFLLRVVPGTYVVLPCDPTITARPVLMEDYFDHIEKQEVFPEDSLIDTRPLNSHGVKEAAALHSKKSRLQKMKKKKKKTPPEQGLSQQKLSPKASTKTTKEASYAPMDLQQQLKDLQEREHILKGSVWAVDVKQQPKQKKKKMQEQIQIRQHLEEIQLHLQKQSEEIQRKLDEEKKAKAAEISHRKYDRKNSLQKSSAINSNHPVEQNEIPPRKKRESFSKKNSVLTDSHNKTGKHQRPPDFKLLRAIIREKGVVSPKGSDPLALHNNNYKLLHHDNEENHSYRLSKQELPIVKPDAGTITSVPKFSQNIPLKTESSQLQP